MSPEENAQPSHGVTRRRVLKWTGAGVGAAVVAGAAGVGIRGAANGGFAAGAGDPYELWGAWNGLTGTDRVVVAGVLACNPHNTQPWIISTAGNEITIASDPNRRMPVNDAMEREHFAGVGCAIENMVIAASAVGTQVRVGLFPDGTSADLVAQLTLRPDAGPKLDADLEAAIPRRHTNRGAYRPDPVDTAVLARLAGTQPISGASVVWITDATAKAGLGALYIEATQAIVADQDQSVEAFSWFRNDRPDIEHYRDGLTLDCQGLDGLTLFLAKVLPAQSRTEGDQFWVKSTREVHTATAAAYGVVVVDDVTDRADQVAGGRLLARLQLGATAAGLGFHHMNQITERIDRAAALRVPDDFSERWAGIIGAPAAKGLVSFRVGHPEREALPSPRRELSDIVRR